MTRFLFIALALTGCSKSSTNFADAKRVAQTVTTDGATYSIEIPDGLPKSKRDAGDWSDATVEHDSDPKVFTGVYPLDMPTELEAAKKDVALSPDKGDFVRAEQRPTGWAVTIASKDKHRLEASTLTKVGDKLIKCHAVQVSEDAELPSYDKTKAMLEAICDSVKAK